MNLPLIFALAAVLPPTPLQIQQQSDASFASNANEKALQRAVELTRAREEAPSPPGATETLTGALAFTFKSSDGRTFTFTGTGVLTIEGGTQPPPVTETKLTGIRDPATGLLVTTTTPGTRLQLEGTNLTSETILVSVGGERSAVLRQSAQMVEFVCPVVPAGKPNILVLYWLIDNNWVNKGQLPLTVTSGPVPPIPPIPPTPTGANPRIDSILPSGDRVTLTGAGFGAATGRVLLDKRPMSVLSWADGRVDCRMGQESVFTNVVVDIWRPSEGWYTAAWQPLGGTN